MELSIFLAKVFGLIMLLAGLGMLMDKKYYEKIVNNFTDNPAQIYMDGVGALIVGIALVTYHNIWEGEWWVVLITIFAWLTLLKGLVRVLLPKLDMEWINSLLKKKDFLSILAVISVVLGAVLSYYGFLA